MTTPRAHSPRAASGRGIRRLGRERALQLLYALDYAAPDEPPEEVERRFLAAERQHRRGWGPFARELAVTVHTHRDALDAAIAPLLQHWTLGRLPRVERLCLRMALAELRHFPEIPLRVTLNEYVELARRFSGEEATDYINAVLDRLARDFPHKDLPAGGGADAGEGSAPAADGLESEPEDD